jgi:hypothetical protein
MGWVLLPILKGQVADRQLLQHFSGKLVGWFRLRSTTLRCAMQVRSPDCSFWVVIERSTHFFSKIGQCRVWVIAVTASDLTAESVTAK